jgi:hypothetical protein
MLKELMIENLVLSDAEELKKMLIGLAKLKSEEDFEGTPNGVIMNFKYGMFIPSK